jgi:hypothetical protein
MAEKDPKAIGPESSQTLTDEQIATERKMPRRSFLTAAGALLVGAAALASGVRAVAQQGSDPDSKKAADPDSKDKKKGSDPDSKKRKKTAANTADPDSKAAADADSKDRKKSSDPDSKSKTADPQSKRAAKAKAKTPPKTDPDGARY